MPLLMLGVFIKKSFRLINLLTILSLVFGFILVFKQSSDMIKVFNESYIIDSLSIFMKMLTLLFSIFVLILSKDYIKNNNMDKIEYPIIILASILGMLVMISSYDLIVFYLGLELQSLCLYILAAFKSSAKIFLKYCILTLTALSIKVFAVSVLRIGNFS